MSERESKIIHIQDIQKRLSDKPTGQESVNDFILERDDEFNYLRHDIIDLETSSVLATVRLVTLGERATSLTRLQHQKHIDVQVSPDLADMSLVAQQIMSHQHYFLLPVRGNYTVEQANQLVKQFQQQNHDHHVFIDIPPKKEKDK